MDSCSYQKASVWFIRLKELRPRFLDLWPSQPQSLLPIDTFFFYHHNYEPESWLLFSLLITTNRSYDPFNLMNYAKIWRPQPLSPIGTENTKREKQKKKHINRNVKLKRKFIKKKR